MEETILIPFDPKVDRMFCSYCGTQLVKSGHIASEFMLCPNHGEFTIAPVIMREPEQILGEPPMFKFEANSSPDAGKWFIHADPQLAGMLETCRSLDIRRG